jgi:hypothetical protein
LDKKFQFTYPLASTKNFQATGEAFSPQKRTSSISKHEIFSLFSIFVGLFCPPGSGSTDLMETETLIFGEKKLPYVLKLMITHAMV